MLASDDFAEKYYDFLDEASFVDWYLANEFSKNCDAVFLTSVYFYYNPADGKIYLGPNWDYDLGFGNYNSGEDTNGDKTDIPTGWYIKDGRRMYTGSEYKAHWINRLFESEKFSGAVKKRWHEKSGLLENTIKKKIPEFAGELYDYIEDNKPFTDT